MNTPRSSSPTATSGFNLVEILLATAVLGAILLPVIGLMTSGKTDQQAIEGMGEAVTLAQNIMERLSSSAVPFEAIVPDGGGRFIRGGTNGTVPQAGFRDTTVASVPFVAADLEKLLCDAGQEVDRPEGTYRVRRVRGRDFLICFFAGKYPDNDSVADADGARGRRAAIESTLTFAHVERPAGPGIPFKFVASPLREQLSRSKLLDREFVQINGINAPDLPLLPYSQKPVGVKPGNPPQIATLVETAAYSYRNPRSALAGAPGGPAGYELITGWPNPTKAGVTYGLEDGSGAQRTKWGELVSKLITRNGAGPTLEYHPVVRDQRDFALVNGGLMKLYVGVKFSPYAFGNLRRVTSFREFWLVSFKARLE